MKTCLDAQQLSLSSRGGSGGAVAPVVQLSGVRKSFVQGSSSSCVLDGIDLIARRGECIFLISLYEIHVENTKQVSVGKINFVLIKDLVILTNRNSA